MRQRGGRTSTSAAKSATGAANGDSVAGRVQLRLVRYYGLEQQPAIEPFVASDARVTRECVVVRQRAGELELSVYLPPDALTPQGPSDVDTLCQLMEGVSHFVLLAERARRELPTTQLELELQAEVDKFLLLSEVDRGGRALHEVSWLRERLFARVRFLFAQAAEEGARYRLANRVAGRFAEHLQQRYLRAERLGELKALLRRFYCVSPSDKLSWAQAA